MTAEFIHHFQESLATQSLVKLSLSKPTQSAEDELKNVYARLVQLKTGLQVQFTLRYAFKDVTKNLPIDEAANAVETWLSGSFLIANLHTTTHIFTIEPKNGVSFLKKTKNTATANTIAPVFTNNKEKNRRIALENNIWLHRLGITNAKGEVLKDKQAKFKQIDKYLEVMDGLLSSISTNYPEKNELRIADMGAGKGYLTFALYDLLNSKNKNPLIYGVEQRKDVVATANSIAEESGFSNLHFIENTVDNYDASNINVLIALHACDTATDDALAKGIRANADLIVVAPCCHKQVRKAMRVPANLQPILQHGILLERQAELLTDSIRSLILEKQGYTTKVFEFISLEHTGKNVMITATRHAKKVDTTKIQAQIDELKTMFGIAVHALEELLF